jgi:hypothetical protein
MEVTMKAFRVFLVGLFLAAWVAPALADCQANGRRYRTGDIVGDYQCQPDGGWKRVPRR